jgi:hypothetical protein
MPTPYINHTQQHADSGIPSRSGQQVQPMSRECESEFSHGLECTFLLAASKWRIMIEPDHFFDSYLRLATIPLHEGSFVTAERLAVER